MDISRHFESLKRLCRAIAPYAWVALLGFAFWLLGKEWGEFHFGELSEALGRIGAFHITLALLLTAVSLFCNAALELVALHWLGLKLPTARVLGTAFIAGSFSMNAGGTLLGGGAVRMRFYSQYGVGGTEVAKISGFMVIAGWLGHALLAGITLCWSPPVLDWLPASMGRAVGALLLVACAVIVALPACGFGWGKARFLPPWRHLFVAMLVAGLDWFFAGMAMRVFLPASISTPQFLAAVAIGQALGAASHVPGGLGVMEFSISRFAQGMVPAPMIAGALVTYRLTYYLIPFVLAVAAVAGREVWAKRHWAKKTIDGTGKIWSAIAPRLAAMSALAGGFVLMLSASTPMESGRRDFLRQFVPLPFVESSHFLSSIAGTVMIIAASGLLRRVRAAWWIAVAMAAGGIVFSLLKGFDWEEAVVLAVFLAALLPFRSKFPRHAGIWTRRFSLQWWTLIVAIIGLAIWFGFYAYRQVEYGNDLWWEYSFDNDASRLLRGMAGSALILVFVALLQWLRPAPPRARTPCPGMDRIEEMVRNSPRSASALALLGDKEFLFNYDQSAFLMFADNGRTRVAMADPVGDEEKFEGLYWRFMEQAQDEGMRVAFYQVGAAMMPLCVEMGMRIYKLGEEAMVPLETFDLSSSAFKKFRKVMNRIEREGWSFEIWEPQTVAERMAELREVSDAWMAMHGAKEKGFSLGWFNEDYLKRLPVAVIMVGGRVAAFGNIWPGNGKDELSSDLMRHVPDAPNGVMDCLFVSLMLWGKEKGYRWFDLGMAPLSGLADNRMAPLWNRIGGLIFDKGEAFYNFNGLRAWKEKFQPVWQPRYLALSKAWDLPAAILDITVLIGKGPAKNRRDDPA